MARASTARFCPNAVCRRASVSGSQSGSWPMALPGRSRQPRMRPPALIQPWRTPPASRRSVIPAAMIFLGSTRGSPSTAQKASTTTRLNAWCTGW